MLRSPCKLRIRWNWGHGEPDDVSAWRPPLLCSVLPSTCTSITSLLRWWPPSQPPAPGTFRGRGARAPFLCRPRPSSLMCRPLPLLPPMQPWECGAMATVTEEGSAVVEDGSLRSTHPSWSRGAVIGSGANEPLTAAISGAPRRPRPPLWQPRFRWCTGARATLDPPSVGSLSSLSQPTLLFPLLCSP
jgi:hypothetical protein